MKLIIKTGILFFIVVAIVIVVTMRITGIGTLIVLPSAADVVALEISQFENHNYIGSVRTTERSDIETIMSSLSNSRQTNTWIAAANDHPPAANFLTIWIEGGVGGRYIIYHNGNTYNIYVPYEGIFRMNRNGYYEIHRINEMFRQ